MPQQLLQTLNHTKLLVICHTRSTAEDCAGGAMIEWTTMPVWRKDFSVLEDVSPAMRQFDR
mgnify:CR=1 FL=1